ncbi:MAG: hypothetical protein JRJ04_17860 [Deltaproteobacteria bacterium]|nr:hypothetical protein [Deltaproteobacteria bacterium]
MNSTMFPGKIIKPLAGKPVLWYILHSLHKCSTVDLITIATLINHTNEMKRIGE